MERQFESGYELTQRLEEIAEIKESLEKRDSLKISDIEKGKYNLEYDLSENRVWGTIKIDGKTKKIDLTRKFETSGGVKPVDEEDLKIIEGAERLKNPYRLEYDNIFGSIDGEKIDELYGEKEEGYEIDKKRTDQYDAMKNLYLRYCAIARFKAKDKKEEGVLSRDHGKTIYEIMAERKYDEKNLQEERKSA